MYTKPLIEQHFHGAFGVDFNTASVDDVLYLAKKIKRYGIGGIFPTIVTDTVENTQKAISVIKNASAKQTSEMAKIFGIHLEGIFLNPEKKGIHDEKLFLKPTVENFKLIEDDCIKIVTLAPEFASFELLQYLNKKGIKIQAGHCMSGDLTGVDGVTHIFNAMSSINHRGASTTLSALINDNIYTEIIADGVHVSDDTLRLLFKTKPQDKIILVSDCLPITKSGLKEAYFAGEHIYYDGVKAVSKEGTLAGSTTLLPQVIQLLYQKKMFNPNWINNPYKYHNINLDYTIGWSNDWALFSYC